MTGGAGWPIVAAVQEDAMTYAPATRAIYDADSHIMELPGARAAAERPLATAGA
jgi:hypothetical protein